MPTAARYGRRTTRTGIVWLPLALLVLAEIGYPLVDGGTRAALVVTTVVAGYLASVGHAALTRGARSAAVLMIVTTGGGLLVEALGVATGLPFGQYRYAAALGPRLLGVPLVIPLAWTWMAWPAWLVAGQLVAGHTAAGQLVAGHTAAGRLAGRVLLAGYALAAWDLFLDPQMVHEGYWRWAAPRPALPGVPTVPVGNHLGWLVVGVALMALLAMAGGEPVRAVQAADAPMLALYVWTFAASVLAHAALLGLPASAAWGAGAMGLVVGALLIRLWRARPDRLTSTATGRMGPG